MWKKLQYFKMLNNDVYYFNKHYLWRNEAITFIVICFNTSGIFKCNVSVKNNLIYCIIIFKLFYIIVNNDNTISAQNRFYYKLYNDILSLNSNSTHPSHEPYRSAERYQLA